MAARRPRITARQLDRAARADRRDLRESLHGRRGLPPHLYARKFPERVRGNPYWRAAQRALQRHPGVAAYFSKRGDSGAAWRDLNVLYCPAPVDAWGCAVFFHELHHLLTPRQTPRYLEELDADLYGFRIATQLLGNQRMPRWLRKRLSDHLHRALEKAIRRGLRAVHPRAKRFLPVESRERLERMIRRTPRRHTQRVRAR